MTFDYLIINSIPHSEVIKGNKELYKVIFGTYDGDIVIETYNDEKGLVY